MLRKIDVTDAANPMLRGNFSREYEMKCVHKSGEYLFLSSSKYALEIYYLGQTAMPGPTSPIAGDEPVNECSPGSLGRTKPVHNPRTPSKGFNAAGRLLRKPGNGEAVLKRK